MRVGITGATNGLGRAMAAALAAAGSAVAVTGPDGDEAADVHDEHIATEFDAWLSARRR